MSIYYAVCGEGLPFKLTNRSWGPTMNFVFAIEKGIWVFIGNYVSEQKKRTT